MRRAALYMEITDVSAGSAEVLIIGTDHGGEQCVVDAQQVPWPIPARVWRPMWDTARRWLTTDGIPTK